MFMELLDIMNERFSVRKYVDKPVEPEKLDKILNAAHAAPTAANQQPVKLLVVLSPESLEKLGKAANIYGAPVAVIVCADKTKAWKRPSISKRLLKMWLCTQKSTVHRYRREGVSVMI